MRQPQASQAPTPAAPVATRLGAFDPRKALRACALSLIISLQVAQGISTSRQGDAYFFTIRPRSNSHKILLRSSPIFSSETEALRAAQQLLEQARETTITI